MADGITFGFGDALENVANRKRQEAKDARDEAFREKQFGLQERQVGMQEARLGMDQERFGMEKDLHALNKQILQSDLAAKKFDMMDARQQRETTEQLRIGETISSLEDRDRIPYLRGKIAEANAAGQDPSEYQEALEAAQDPQKWRMYNAELENNLKIGLLSGKYQTSSQNLPAGLQTAARLGEIRRKGQQALSNNDLDLAAELQTQYNEILISNKAIEKGSQVDLSGRLGEQEGFFDFTQQSSAAETKGKKEIELEFNPQIAAAVEAATAKVSPLPESKQKMQTEALEKIALNTSIQTDLQTFSDAIRAGQLQLDIPSNVANKIKNNTNLSDEESRLYGSLAASINKLRNDSLRLNNGVQTEGDAQRALDELLSNLNDTEFVLQRLDELSAINRRASGIQKFLVNDLRQGAEKEEFDFTELESIASQRVIGRNAQTQPTQNVTIGGESQVKFLGFE